ncbi:phage holin [Clostridium sp. BNL1100]|uniref:phage holin n=1 Tax=Clostridium sp. BNL1100 TaxID=755731 RepID=UPI00024A7A8A|nr:phage holin [Clostridium sp. BNL1100]AEY66594.1 Bacteriophage holin [Clostridium sp. BNL1100]
MNQNRFKSWSLWLAVASLVVFCVKTFFNLDVSVEMNGFMNVLCPVLIGIGIINNPTNKTEI